MRAPCILCGIAAMIGLGALGLYFGVPYSGTVLVYGCVAALCYDW